MMAGVDCSEPSAAIEGRQCAYPARFARWLGDTYYGDDISRVKFQNRAQGGTTTAGALPQLALLISGGQGETPDLVIVDFGVNDRFEEQDWLSHETSRRGVGDGDNAGAKVFAATEALLRYILKAHSTTAVVIVDAYCERDISFSKRAHKKAALILGVPYITYSRLTRHGCNQQACGGKPCFRTPHPSFAVHEFVKVGLGLWWETFAWRLKCRTPQQVPSGAEAISFMLSEPPVAPRDLLLRYSVCERPLSVFDARSQHQENEQRGTVRGWQLALDNGRDDKAAWIASEDGSVVEFYLRFGQSPRIALVYTKGYDETFGEAEVSMSGSSAKYKLHGCCNNERVTQGELLVMNVGQTPMASGKSDSNSHGFGFGIQPFANATLRLKFIRSKSVKFSVSFLSSC
jgi:hypothetical protein